MAVTSNNDDTDSPMCTCQRADDSDMDGIVGCVDVALDDVTLGCRDHAGAAVLACKTENQAMQARFQPGVCKWRGGLWRRSMGRGRHGHLRQ